MANVSEPTMVLVSVNVKPQMELVACGYVSVCATPPCTVMAYGTATR
ncbi:hypothetical protein PR001_g8193 [Phytophthora rubi]|uniref:Uncharacterized protein n=1 Tax=Phytophthora rubi TaxID=129364 RepID=A0A6A3NC38_9STRA|nr:hypothetical protein PR001_g8193 [Phytophthora rubi]